MEHNSTPQQSAFVAVGITLLSLTMGGCLAWGKHQMLPPSKYVSALSAPSSQSVALYQEGEVPNRACIRIAKVAAHGNGYATRETLESTIRDEAASIGAEFVVLTGEEITKDEVIGSHYGGWGWGSMWGTSVYDSIKRPHLYGIACRNAAVRLGIHLDKDRRVTYVVRDSTADRLGIKEGDRLLAINGRFLAADSYTLDLEVLSKRPGDNIVVEYMTIEGTKIAKDIALEEWR